MSNPINVSENLESDVDTRYRDVGTGTVTQLILLLVQGLRYLRRNSADLATANAKLDKLAAAVDKLNTPPPAADRLEVTLGTPQPKP